jgi:hypothetical protein
MERRLVKEVKALVYRGSKVCLVLACCLSTGCTLRHLDFNEVLGTWVSASNPRDTLDFYTFVPLTLSDGSRIYSAVLDGRYRHSFRDASGYHSVDTTFRLLRGEDVDRSFLFRIEAFGYTSSSGWVREKTDLQISEWLVYYGLLPTGLFLCPHPRLGDTASGPFVKVRSIEGLVPLYQWQGPTWHD